MSTLVVSATSFEINQVLEREAGIRVEGRGAAGTLFRGARCDLLVTGVGQVPCAAHLSKALSTGSYDRVIQGGIAGSFTTEIPIGSTAVVSEELFGDLGAESQGTFLDPFEMGLLSGDEAPFSGRALVAPVVELPSLVGIPRVRSVTVNRVLSESHSIAWVRERYAPSLVNMEGAALFYTCLTYRVPFLSLRSVSDMVGPRDKAAWRIAEAVTALQGALFKAISEW